MTAQTGDVFSLPELPPSFAAYVERLSEHSRRAAKVQLPLWFEQKVRLFCVCHDELVRQLEGGELDELEAERNLLGLLRSFMEGLPLRAPLGIKLLAAVDDVLDQKSPALFRRPKKRHRHGMGTFEAEMVGRGVKVYEILVERKRWSERNAAKQVKDALAFQGVKLNTDNESPTGYFNTLRVRFREGPGGHPAYNGYAQRPRCAPFDASFKPHADRLLAGLRGGDVEKKPELPI